MTAPLKIIITEKADADEIAIYQYISEKFGNTFAEKFRIKLINLFKLIALQPFIGRPAKNDASIRVFIMSKQNKVVYKLKDSEIIILRILNARTNLAGEF